MSLNQYLNTNFKTNCLKRFAYVGNRVDFDKKLHYLTTISEPENWYQKENDDVPPVIFYYIIHTFNRIFEQEKLEINDTEDICVGNTGLITPQGDEIYFYFVKSPTHDPEKITSNYWYLKKFICENEQDFIRTGLKRPSIASYFDDYNELFFDANLKITLNFDHIFGERSERLPIEFGVLPIDIARQSFNGFLEHTKKRIKRNNRIPVPQYYKGKIMFLIPVTIFNSKIVVIAVEKIGNEYIANTTLTKTMAYNCARLLNKPESNWLLIE
ncbi:MAG: DUF3825 domain-containing protein [Erysipelotrichaceae bacterium]|nr:DUF3825 domain-containing protein [Erysipelotrichaceae bacterium]